MNNNPTVISDSSDKDDIERKNVSDSEEKKTGDQKVFIDRIENKIIYFDPSNEKQIDAVLDRYNEIKEILDNIDFKTVHEIEIQDEIFNYNEYEGGFLITHPKWSLMGYGKNLYEAEKDLIDNMDQIADDYIDEPDSNLSIDAIELKEYLFNVLY